MSLWVFFLFLPLWPLLEWLRMYLSFNRTFEMYWLTLQCSAAIMILFISALSWYTGYEIGQFKLRHPEIHSMGDAGELLMGRVGREVLGIGQLLLLIFLMASNILTFNILMNVLTDHSTCTLVFGVVGLVICFLGALPRTMEKVYWMSCLCECSLIRALMIA